MKCRECKKLVKWGKFAKKIELASGFCPNCWNKPFNITSICRADLTDKFTAKQIALLDNDDMEVIADEMADAYCNNGFWIDSEIIVDQVLEDKDR